MAHSACWASRTAATSTGRPTFERYERASMAASLTGRFASGRGDEVDHDLRQLRPPIPLEKVPPTHDGGVGLPRGPGDRRLEERVGAPGDRILIGERGEEVLLELGQPLPGEAVGG